MEISGITVMGYNNDVDMVKVFGQLYKVFLGTKPDDPTFVELFYSVGLALGIFLFFNHVPGLKKYKLDDLEQSTNSGADAPLRAGCK